jgi:hypothetical protein
VKDNYKRILADIEEANEAHHLGKYTEVGRILARIESYIVGNAASQIS